MTLIEFIAPLRRATNRSQVLAVLYYRRRYEGVKAMTVDQIRADLRQRARIPNVARMNIADVLAKSGAFVETAGSEGGKALWGLTSSGEQEVRKLLGLPKAEPEVEHDVSSLTKLAATISDTEAKEFLEEAIKCLQVGALRASVVFLWSGAIRTLQQTAWAKGGAKVNAVIQKHDPKARHISGIDDFAYVKDKTTLLGVQDLGILDKGQRGTLEEALNLRNRCGHPTKYRPGEKKVSSFIEDVTGIVF